MKNKIPVIIIEFNSFQRTIKYIKDFSNKVICDDEIFFIVVDNAINMDNYNALIDNIKSDFQVNSIEKDMGHINEPRIKNNLKFNVEYDNKNFDIIAVKSKDNYGFAIGNNIGANIAQQMYSIDVIIFSNSDIQFKNSGFNLSKMINIMKSNEKIALIGPRIVGLDNKAQTPCCRKSLWDRWNYQSIFFPFSLYINKKALNNSDDTLFIEKDSFVYRILGAFMIFDFKIFNSIKMFDENTFLYAEELIIAEKLQNSGYETYYCNSEELIHEQGGTTKKVLNIYNKLKMRFKSEIYYYEHYRNIKKQYIYISKLLFSMYIIKLKFFCFLKQLVKRKKL